MVDYLGLEKDMEPESLQEKDKATQWVSRKENEKPLVLPERDIEKE